MRHKRLSRSFDEDEEINLTPLIDVVFVVLIMFILIAPMLEIDKIQLSGGPETKSTDAIAQSELVIQVRENNAILINQQEISPDHLRPLLQALHAKNPKTTPQLYHDEKAQFGTYQTVKNALEDAGYSNLDVILKSGKS